MAPGVTLVSRLRLWVVLKTSDSFASWSRSSLAGSPLQGLECETQISEHETKPPGTVRGVSSFPLSMRSQA